MNFDQLHIFGYISRVTSADSVSNKTLMLISRTDADQSARTRTTGCTRPAVSMSGNVSLIHMSLMNTYWPRTSTLYLEMTETWERLWIKCFHCRSSVYSLD